VGVAVDDPEGAGDDVAGAASAVWEHALSVRMAASATRTTRQRAGRCTGMDERISVLILRRGVYLQQCDEVDTRGAPAGRRRRPMSGADARRFDAEDGKPDAIAWMSASPDLRPTTPSTLAAEARRV